VADRRTDIIDRLGIRTSRYRRWPDDKTLHDKVTAITLPTYKEDGEEGPPVTGAVTDEQAVEVMRQLAYRLGYEVHRG